jgi:hypothetical protein
MAVAGVFQGQAAMHLYDSSVKETPVAPDVQLDHHTYLPVIMHSPAYTLRGRVVSEEGAPVAGVSVVDQTGRSAITEADGIYTFRSLPEGDYSLAPQGKDYKFWPSEIDVSLGDNTNLGSFNALTACSEAIINGGFEVDGTWQFPVTEYPASYTVAAAHSGTRALRSGITDPGANKYSYSSTRQLISIPANTTSAILRVWLYPVSGEAVNLDHELTSAEKETAVLANDAQYVLVLDPGANPVAVEDDTLKETLLWMRSNSQTWQLYEFNLTKYAGKTIKIQIGAYNDGWGGVTALYADDVSLELCDDPVAPVPAPTPGCSNYLTNPGFEYTGAWSIPVTTYPAGYSVAQAHAGLQSMRTGIVNPNVNVYSYSDAGQLVTIPSGATASLSMYVYTLSTEVTQAPLPVFPTDVPFGEAPLASDAQYILVLDQWGNILEQLWTRRKNSTAWNVLTFDLSDYAGKTIQIQFGSYNDGIGGITAMYVDDAILDVCTAGVSPTPTTPAPTATPAPTPLPGTCTERIGNNGFEVIDEWEIPVTAFSASYSSAQAHTGAYAMRNGIVNSSHNRYSYSDAYQVSTLALGSSSATLNMWIYPISGEALAQESAQAPGSELHAGAASGNDIQYVLLLDKWGNWIDTLWWQRVNNQTWGLHTFDISRYAGSTIRLQFGVYNDGWNGVTAMYVDDVTLQDCP